MAAQSIQSSTVVAAVAAKTTEAEAPAKAQRFQTLDMNFNATKAVWNYPTSENCLVYAAAKTACAALAALTGLAELIQNMFYALANAAIVGANHVYSLFETTETAKTEEVVKTSEHVKTEEVVKTAEAEVVTTTEVVKTAEVVNTAEVVKTAEGAKAAEVQEEDSTEEEEVIVPSAISQGTATKEVALSTLAFADTHKAKLAAGAAAGLVAAKFFTYGALASTAIGIGTAATLTVGAHYLVNHFASSAK
jgi:hypothetical protein